MQRLLVMLAGLLVLGGCASSPALPRMPGNLPISTDPPTVSRPQPGPVVARPRVDPRGAPTSAPTQQPAGGTAAAAPTAETFQPGPFSGPPRWGFDSTFAEKIARLRVFVSGSFENRDQRVGGEARSALGLYTLNLARQTAITFRDVMAQQAVPATLLDCEYRRTERTSAESGDKDFKPEFIKMFFWQSGARKVLSAQMLKPYQNRSDQIADVELATCPPDFASALTAGFGEAAWTGPTQLALKARDTEFQKNFALGIWSPVEVNRGSLATQAAAWQAQAASMPAAKDADIFALAAKIDADIGSLESSIDALNSRPFNDKLVGPNGLFERINRLALAAYAKSALLTPSPAGRSRFDEWDERLGGPALTAINRLQKIVYYRQNRRVRLSEALGGDAGKSEMKSWGNVDFSPMWPAQSSLLEVFSRHLEGRPLIDPAFLTALTKDLERTRPSGDPGRPFYYHVPADPKPTWLMTPAEIEAQGSKVAGNMVGAANSVGDMVRLIEKIDADIRNSREAFWKCYASRCKQSGKPFYAYSFAMRNKDEFYFFMPTLLSDPQLARGLSFLGNGSIDGGPIANCEAPRIELESQLATKARQSVGNPVQSARAVQEVMKGQPYLAWQACRDRMEYILRPRFPTPT